MPTRRETGGARSAGAIKARDASRFDLIVVGAGSAGFGAALKGAKLGARVALVEGRTLGGTCVNVGCIPSKGLLRTAEAHYRRTHHGVPGVPTTDGQPLWPTVQAGTDALVGELRQKKYWDVLGTYPSITLFQERACLSARGEVRLASGRVLGASRIVVTTGASSWAPPLPGLAEAGFKDSTAALALERLPQSLIVIGAGAIGLELAQAFQRLGVRVTVLEACAQVLPGEEIEIGHALGDYLRAEGLEVHAPAAIERVERGERGYLVAFSVHGVARTAQAEELLVATGRRANTAGLGLEAVGVALGRKGEILVDEFLETGSRGTYAAGDVIGEPMLVYVAAYAGALAAENALAGNVRRYDLNALPRVTFTDPAVAAVGLTEGEARARGMAALATRLPLEHVPRALVARDRRGFVKLVADARTRCLIGAHILAAEAGELITAPALGIKFGLTIEDLSSSFHPYLTLSEGIKLAAQSFTQDVRTLSCCAD